MTGTALTEEKEFRDIYGMDVVEIPTNRPVQRKDLDDAVYMTKKEKFNAVVASVKEAHERQQPVLVGTITIETSELLSRMLRREGFRTMSSMRSSMNWRRKLLHRQGRQVQLRSQRTWQAVVRILSWMRYPEMPAD